MTTRQDDPPLVLLHALGLDASMWDIPREALGDLGHTVLAPDQRGFGSTPLGEAAPSLDVAADDLARLLDRRGIDRAALVGTSMGGYVAMTFLERHPDRVLALALLSTRARADDPAERTAREAWAAHIARPEHAPDLVAASALKLVGATTRAERPAVFARVRALAAAAAPASLAWAQQAIAIRRDFTHLLRATTVPVLMLAGEEDELVSMADQRETARTLRRGRLVTIPGAGHLPPMEAPERVVGELLRLLDEIGTFAC